MMMARLVGLFLVLLLLAPGAGAQEAKLRVSMQVAITHPLAGVSMARLKEEVERRSGKTLILEVFDKGKLFKDAQVVDAVSSGAVDLGVTSSQMFVKRVPAVSILDLPFLFNYRALIRAAASPGSDLRKAIDEIVLKQAGIRILWWQLMGDRIFQTKGLDVADVGRLKGLRVAAAGKAMEDFVSHCGGTPNVVNVMEMADAIKQGKLDGAAMTLSSFQALGLWKATDTLTYTVHTPVEYFLFINEKAWQSLSPAHRAIMTDATRAVESEAYELLAKVEASVERFAGEKGAKIVHLTPDNFADWRACSADQVADYMARNAALALRLMAAYSKLRTDPCCTAGPSGAAFTRR
jgi:TRAP-type C4-dicarboxylate transport system substrate-binding protein